MSTKGLILRALGSLVLLGALAVPMLGNHLPGELGLLLFEYSCGEADRARDLYRAYRDAGGPGQIDRPGNFSMVIAQIAHIGEISCARWLDPSRVDARERNTGRIDEFVTEGITRTMIDDILAALDD